MQREREVRENSTASGSPFDSFGGSGFRRSMFPSIFGGKDPFDDPFFSRPHGSLFGSNMFSTGCPGNLQQTSKLKEPVIKELDSDAEDVPEEEEDDVRGTAWLNRNPLVEHPEDQANDHGRNPSNGREISHATNHAKVGATPPQTRSVSFQRVTYGGINGAYYTATTSRGTGSDGVTLEESKQADRTTGQATHRVSRGIHDKGHSVTRKLDSDGKVDTVQTLHNLNEDQLAGFEQAWGANTDRGFRGWGNTFDFPGISGTGSGQLAAWGGFGDPFREHFYTDRVQSFDQNLQGQCAGGKKPKKVVTINIE